MSKLCVALAGVVAVFVFNPGSIGSAQAPAASSPAITEELIVEKDAGSPIDDKEDVVSNDGRSAAWRTARGKKWTVMLNAMPQAAEFDEVKWLVFSPDGRHLAFAGRHAKAWVMVVDGKEGATTFDEISGPQFNADGQRIAYFGKPKGSKWIAIVDGEPVGKGFDGMEDGMFSPDGKRFAYVGRRGNQYIMVVDAVEGPAFDVIGGFRFSPDGRRFAYAGVDVKNAFGGDKGLGSILIDGEPGAAFEGEKASGLFEAMTTGPISLVHGYFGDLTHRLHGVSVPVFSADGLRVAYVAHRDKDNEVVIVDGKEGPQFAAITSAPDFSRDGKRIAYVARRGKDDEAVIVDGQPGPRFSSIVAGPWFCNEGRRVAYVVLQDTGKFLIVDGERVGPAMLSGADFVLKPVFAPDSRRVAHVAVAGSFWAAVARNLATGITSGEKERGRTGKHRVYVDGQPGAEYDAGDVTGLRFSADGRHVIYVVHRLKDGERRVSLVVTNRTEGKKYDAVWTRTLDVQDSGTATYVAETGRKFVRVTHAIQ